VLTQISNNDSTAPAEGAMVMFEPMVGPDQGPRLRGKLAALATQMVSGGSGEQRSLPEPIRLYGPDGRSIGLTPISSLGPLLTSLRDDLLLLLVLLVPLLLIRMQLTLAHRRQRLGALHRERLASERFRRVCRALALIGYVYLFTASCSFFSSLYPVRAEAEAAAATSVDAFLVTSNIIAIDLCSALFVICGFVAAYTHANMTAADWCEFAKIVSLYVLVDLWLSTCGTLVLGSIFHLVTSL
jgi:hypothetical protein